MFKSQLQEYTQKAGLAAPVYDVGKEGVSHEPQFRASVTINGKVYESPRLFGSLKKAEHAAAEVALAALGKSETGPLHESGLCKNLLQEYAQKTKLPLPIYTVVRSGESHTPSFCATVEIAGVHYNGGQCKTKKEAEIRAARTALVAIYSDSGASTLGVKEEQTMGTVDVKEEQTMGTVDVKEEKMTDELASLAGEAPSEPKYTGKRKKKLKYNNKRRRQKVKDEQTENAKDVGNTGNDVVDLKQADPSPGSLVEDLKQEDPALGTLVNDSKQADPSPENLVVVSKQADPSPETVVDDLKQVDASPPTDPSPETVVDDLKQVDASPPTDAGPITSWVPEQEHISTASESCIVANSKVSTRANGSAQEQEA